MIGNSCARFGEVALYAEFTFQGAVIANNIVDKAAMGISVTNFNEGGRLAVVQGNLISNVFFRKDVDARGIGIGVSVDSAAGKALITDNLISGAKDGAIRAINGATPTGPDLATASAAAYPNLAVYSNIPLRPQNESGKN
jgi:putative cofactor-binding repeat protein